MAAQDPDWKSMTESTGDRIRRESQFTVHQSQGLLRLGVVAVIVGVGLVGVGAGLGASVLWLVGAPVLFAGVSTCVAAIYQREEIRDRMERHGMPMPTGLPDRRDASAAVEAWLSPKGTIFLSYRRSDSTHIVGRIYDVLSDCYGKDSVFVDVESIPLGDDFTDIIAEWIARSDVVVVVIGEGWLNAATPSGRRLDEPTDYVRAEIELALRYQKPLIPLLIDGVRMPAACELPESIRLLRDRNALNVRGDRDFHRDMADLIGSINERIRPGG